MASAWGHWGYDLTNRRWAYNETTLTTSNVANIKLGWSMTTGLDVSATPTIVGGRMYVPDWVSSFKRGVGGGRIGRVNWVGATPSLRARLDCLLTSASAKQHWPRRTATSTA